MLLVNGQIMAQIRPVRIAPALPPTRVVELGSLRQQKKRQRCGGNRCHLARHRSQNLPFNPCRAAGRIKSAAGIILDGERSRILREAPACERYWIFLGSEREFALKCWSLLAKSRAPRDPPVIGWRAMHLAIHRSPGRHRVRIHGPSAERGPGVESHGASCSCSKIQMNGSTMLIGLPRLVTRRINRSSKKTDFCTEPKLSRMPTDDTGKNLSLE